MRKLILLTVVGATMVVAAPAQAQCGNRCLSNKVAALQHQVSFLTGVVRCMGEAPASVYGDPNGTFGYMYDSGSGNPFLTTAVDATPSGSNVSAWLLFDQCNPQATAAADVPSATASAASAVRRHAIAPLFSLEQAGSALLTAPQFLR